MTERTNSQWVYDLRQDGPIGLQAIDDLCERLEIGLYHYLSQKRNDLRDRSPDEHRQIAKKYARESLNKVLDNLASFRGTSQFTTWAARFAARVATADLTCVQAVPVPITPAIDFVPHSVSEAM